jgi:hypothetical protein
LAGTGRWTTLPPYGDEAMQFEDSHIQMLFYVRDQVPKDFRERFNLGPLAWGLYNLDIWNLRGEPRGKVLNINWLTAGAEPRIVTFRRGDWDRGCCAAEPADQDWLVEAAGFE